MRLLIASDHFPPFIGGAHRWAAVLADELAARGHDVTVATMWHGGMPELEHRGPHQVPVHRLRQLRTAASALVRDGSQRHSPPFPDPFLTAALRRVLAESRPEVILSHGWISVSAERAVRGSDIPLILSSHDYGLFCPKRTLLYRDKPCTGPRPVKCLGCAGSYYGAVKGAVTVAGLARFKRAAPPRIAAVHSVSSYLDEMNARHLLGFRPLPRDVPRYVIPPFLNPDPSDEIGAEDLAATLARLPEEPFILFVGALRLVKGVEVLFDAYARLRNPPPLVLVGTIESDGPKRFPPEAIVLTDLPHTAVMEVWRRALIGVMPSVWPEPLGTVAVEGITQGVPVVATIPGGAIDVLGGAVGVLVPQGDAGALANAIQSLIDHPDRREALIRAGLEQAQAFQAEAVVARYEKMLEEVVARARAA